MIHQHRSAAISGSSLLWEFSVRGFVLFVVLTAFLSYLLTSYIRDSLTEVSVDHVDMGFSQIRRMVRDLPSNGSPKERQEIIKKAMSQWVQQWDFAAIGVIGQRMRHLSTSNALVRKGLQQDLDNLEPLVLEREGVHVRVINVQLSDGISRPILAKTFRMEHSLDLGSVRHLVIYAYHADIQWKIEVFQIVVVSSLFACMAILYLAIGVVVKKASDRLLDYSHHLEQQNLELQETKQHLLHTSKLAMLGELAASVAHEIKNPLAAISSGLQLAADRTKGTDIEIMPIFERINGEVERLRKILTSMLKFSRPGNQDAMSFSLNVVVEKVILLIKKRAKDEHVRIEKRLSDNLRDAWGDPSQIEQVVLNLVLNALQAMHGKGGTLRVITENDDQEVWLEVRDTGTGIPPEILARVFAPFMTSRGEEGTGLGLTISKRIVDEHKGRLTLENLAQGVLARVVLPIEPRGTATTNTSTDTEADERESESTGGPPSNDD